MKRHGGVQSLDSLGAAAPLAHGVTNTETKGKMDPASQQASSVLGPSDAKQTIV